MKRSLIFLAKIIGILLFILGLVAFYMYAEPRITQHFYKEIYFQKNAQETEKSYNFFVKWYTFLSNSHLRIKDGGESLSVYPDPIWLAGSFVDAMKLLPNDLPENIKEKYQELVGTCNTVKITLCNGENNRIYTLTESIFSIKYKRYLIQVYYYDTVNEIGHYSIKPTALGEWKEYGKEIDLKSYSCQELVTKNIEETNCENFTEE